MNWTPLDLTVRVGCELVYETPVPTPALFVLKPRLEGRVLVMQERMSFGIGLPAYEFQDSHGNITYRSTLMPGRNEIRHDALVAVSSQPDTREVTGPILPVGQLPCEWLRYTLPSRYCDSDKLLDFAWKHFGDVAHGLPRVQAICDWVHRNIEYRFLSGRSDLSASEVIGRGYGVCRDFAHAAIALCRAFNLPARYVTGHLPDIGYLDPGTPMDFHAYLEVYLGQDWLTFDPRFNVQRIGRVKVAHGADAVDAAFGTIYGAARLTHFSVWAYQVDPRMVSVGDPVDLSRRLDGTPTLRVGSEACAICSGCGADPETGVRAVVRIQNGLAERRAVSPNWLESCRMGFCEFGLPWGCVRRSRHTTGISVVARWGERLEIQASAPAPAGILPSSSPMRPGSHSIQVPAPDPDTVSP